MKINVAQQLKQTNGKPMDVPGEDGQPKAATLRMFAGITLKINRKDDDGDAKYKDWKLAQKIEDSDEVELTVEEAARIKKVLGMHCGPEVVGPCWDILDGK